MVHSDVMSLIVKESMMYYQYLLSGSIGDFDPLLQID